RDSDADCEAAAAALIEDLESQGLGYAFNVVRGAQMKTVWELRKAGLGLLMGVRTAAKPITFVEDTAVAVEDLPEFLRQFAAIMARYDTDSVYYAHASVGELHLRPHLDPKDPSDIEKMKAIAIEVADLVNEFRGSLSGEHGDGRVRSPFIEQVLGVELWDMWSPVKAAFDPHSLCIPGKIVVTVPLGQDLRYEPGRPAPVVETYFSYAEDGRLLDAVERCNGSGVCRKLVQACGTMCPSYHVTHDELHTTRGRANVFRMLLLGDQPEQAMSSHELYEAME